jgi:hypothetical protein
MVTHLSVEQRQLALRLRARGWSLRQIGPQVGCSHELVRIIAWGGASRPQRRADPWVPGPGRLTFGGPGGDQPGPACRRGVRGDRGPAG